jgi:matrixin
MLRPALLATAVLVPLAACSKSPSSPSSPDSGTVQGQTVNAITGSASPGLTVRIGNGAAVTSDGEGFFQVDVGKPGLYQTTVRGSAVVERQTDITGPTADRMRLSLIPSSFDLTAFDEMFRSEHDHLQRWTTRPALVVLASVMSYRSGSGDSYEAESEQLTEQEVSDMIAHLNEGLAMLTGNTYTSFESVSVERPASGTRVNALRLGSIVVGRYNGIVSMVNTIGYGQWADQPDGTVTGGAMFLDREFDRGDARRRLLRIHELGHALGYQHVRSRTSIMNPAIGPEPTDFDRSGAIIAFQRRPGNRSPDVDPSFRAFSVAEGGSRWAPPVICK